MNTSHLHQGADPRTMVTPYAFKIAPELLYTPLANPLKRGLAMTLDGLLVAALAEQAGWVFIFLVGLTLLIQKKSRQIGRWFKWALYAAMLVGLILAAVNSVWPPDEDADSQSGWDKTIEMTGYIPQVVSVTRCEDYACAQAGLVKLQSALNQTSLPEAEQGNILSGVISELNLSETEISKLTADFGRNNGSAALAQSSAEGIEVLATPEPAAIESIEPENKGINDKPLENLQPQGDSQIVTVTPIDLDTESESESQPSVIAWSKGLLNDLGLGFGWAAFYFTVFTAWFDGQTLGKKLLGIRVIQLDGVKMGLWAAFGRYGGYAAGFSTGLLGFMQIFWDANRQAIQDKISATVVIDLRREKNESELASIQPAMQTMAETRQ